MCAVACADEEVYTPDLIEDAGPDPTHDAMPIDPTRATTRATTTRDDAAPTEDAAPDAALDAARDASPTRADAAPDVVRLDAAPDVVALIARPDRAPTQRTMRDGGRPRLPFAPRACDAVPLKG